MLCVLLDYDEIFIKCVKVEGYLIEIIIIVLRNIIKCKIESFYFFVNSVMNVIIRILNCVFYVIRVEGYINENYVDILFYII